MGVKISNLPSIVTPALSDIFPVVQSGVTYKESGTQLSSLFAALGADVTFSSVTFSPTTNGIVGTTTNDNAGAGYVGEIIESEVLVGSAVALTSTMASDITSISLPAGDWDVWGNVFAHPDVTTTTSAFLAWTNTTSATLPTPPNKGAYVLSQSNVAAGFATCFPVGLRRYSFATTTTVYLSVITIFAVSTMNGYGYIGARRVR